ncbi:hypothetical protein QFY99_03950 [Sphingobacterium faecium]|nr:hypothetical protein [Sphingobacterium faecium]
MGKVMVFNGVVGSGSLKVSVSPHDKYWSSISDNMSLYNKGSMVFIAPVGGNIVKATQLTDTTKMLYRSKIEVQENSFYSLYLTGTSTDIDTLFRKEENIPKVPPIDVRKKLTAQDSIIYIRFTNLSYNGPKVNINIRNSINREVNNLGYKESTDFKTYSASSNAPIVFEVRSAVDNSLLMTYGFNAMYFRFRTVEVVIAGSINPDVSFSDRYGVEVIPLL